MDPELRGWRKAERERLIAAREQLDGGALETLRRRIDGHLARAFPGLARQTVVFCWPMRGEYDARPFLETLRARGATTALPVVVGPGQPLVFREWHPGVALAAGPLGIPYPERSATVEPAAVLVPMVGWDDGGYRLGYGAGYFDRTLAARSAPFAAIGVAYELARLPTIRPQAWDVPMDWVVTERGVYRRDPSGLAFLGEPAAGEPGALASPVCYADEIAPDHWDEGERADR
jgi:5,10-methenyltetrahydrofolate synthetase